MIKIIPLISSRVCKLNSALRGCDVARAWNLAIGKDSRATLKNMVGQHHLRKKKKEDQSKLKEEKKLVKNAKA